MTTVIAPLPPWPEPTDPLDTFNTKSFAVGAAFPDFIVEANAQAGENNANAVSAAASQALAAASQSAAAASATAAAGSAGATAWVSGATYASGDKRWSLLNGRVYVRLTAGTGATDPQNDATNWADVIGGRRIRITANTNAVVGCLYEIDSSAGSFNVTLPASFADQDWIGFVDVGMALSTNPVTVVRNGNNIRRIAEDLILDVSADSLRLTGRTTLGWIEE